MASEPGSNGWTPVDRYWGEHTVNSRVFSNPVESQRYLEWRFEQYPLFREFMALFGDHAGETILDYGCGPGDDVVGFLLHSQACKVIGIDVSEKALGLLHRRLALHGVDPARIELIQSSDAAMRIPLEDASIDYINCGGVLHHTSHPNELLTEFFRILRPGGEGRVMVYNRDSLWFHLYTAYIKMIIDSAFPGMSVEEAFARNTDGPACPISRCYRPVEFLSAVRDAGFAAAFVGGYLSTWELKCWEEHGRAALGDRRLPEQHRGFLEELVWDNRFLPLYRGRHAGIGGVYQVTKTP